MLRHDWTIRIRDLRVGWKITSIFKLVGASNLCVEKILQWVSYVVTCDKVGTHENEILRAHVYASTLKVICWDPQITCSLLNHTLGVPFEFIVLLMTVACSSHNHFSCFDSTQSHLKLKCRFLAFLAFTFGSIKGNVFIRKLVIYVFPSWLYGSLHSYINNMSYSS